MTSSKHAVLILVAFLALGTVAAFAQQGNVQITKSGDLNGGEVIKLNVKLDKPLPAETSVIARVQPEGVSQLIVLSSAEPANAARTEVVVSATLPQVVVPGKWRLQDLFIVLPGTNIWQPIGHNELTFEVKGKDFPVPTKGEVSVVK